jgi:hypothetical protein
MSNDNIYTNENQTNYNSNELIDLFRIILVRLENERTSLEQLFLIEKKKETRRKKKKKTNGFVVLDTIVSSY